MCPENIEALEDSRAGRRLVFMTQNGGEMAVVTIPVKLTDPALYRDIYLLLEKGFSTRQEVEAYMKENNLMYVSPLRVYE